MIKQILVILAWCQMNLLRSFTTVSRFVSTRIPASERSSVACPIGCWFLVAFERYSSSREKDAVRKTLIQLVCLMSLFALPQGEAAESKLVKRDAAGRLVMLPWNEQGDKIPDFSYCGYRNGGVKLPDVPTLVTLEPTGAEDESDRIQAALDDLGKSLERTPDGRGALLLRKGLWKVNKPLTMSYSGVVLRGEGDGEDGTVLLDTTKKWVSCLIEVKSSRTSLEWPKVPLGNILDQPYVPVGSTSLRIWKETDKRYTQKPWTESPIQNLKPGDGIIVYKAASTEWIKDIGMDAYKWSGGNAVAFFERKLISLSNGELVIDIPLPQALDQKYGGGMVFPAPPDFRIRECGIERLRFDSVYDPTMRKKIVISGQAEAIEYAYDERHAGWAMGFSKIENSWIRNCTATHMNSGIVNIGEGARNITVQDCTALDPVSLIAGGRRYTYVIAGKAGPSILIQRCTSRNGRHDFMMGANVAGPNAFVDCSSESAWDCSETHHKWTMGTLYDNVRVNGHKAGLCSVNRGRWGGNHGWSGNTTVFWNCASTMIFANQPPLGQNFMIGNSDPGLFDPKWAKMYMNSVNAASGRKDELCEGALQGTAWKESPHESVTPRSLYYAQLEARLGKAAVENVTTYEQRKKQSQGMTVQ